MTSNQLSRERKFKVDDTFTKPTLMPKYASNSNASEEEGRKSDEQIGGLNRGESIVTALRTGALIVRLTS